MAPTVEDIQEEQRVLSNVITAFQNYPRYSISANNRRRKDIYRLPLADQEILEKLGYKKKLDEVDNAILANADFLNQIVANTDIFQNDHPEEEGGGYPGGGGREDGAGHGRNGFRDLDHGHDHSHSHSHSNSHGSHGPYKPTEFDMDKLRSTLKQFVRDWSEEGREEREACYRPMKDALITHFANVPVEERRRLRVLVPGSGLGRLAWDVASMGFSSQGNEFSHYMLLASFFILNRTDAINKHIFYPYIHSFSNIDTRKTMLRAVSIPDVLPSALPPGVRFSLVAGDFEEIYGSGAEIDEIDPEEPQAGKWNAILTCFFIDTAKNIINYLRIIHRILAPGGVWINIGPLLWHWENNSTNDLSVELDLDEVKALAREIGFEISNEKTIDTTYTNNSEGMLKYIYHAAFWTAVKKND